MTANAPKYFFSYSRSDGEFVLRLAQELRAAGVDIWVDQLDILGGERWDQSVERALRSCEGMIVVLSPQSVSSDNVLDEVSYALEKKKRIVPVIKAQCEVPFRLRRLQNVTFTNNFDAGLSMLVKALCIQNASISDGQPPFDAKPSETPTNQEEKAMRTTAISKPLPVTKEEKTRHDLRRFVTGFVAGASGGLLCAVFIDIAAREASLTDFLWTAAVYGGAAAIVYANTIENKKRLKLSSILAAAVALIGVVTVFVEAQIGIIVLLFGVPAAAVLSLARLRRPSA